MPLTLIPTQQRMQMVRSLYRDMVTDADFFYVFFGRSTEWDDEGTPPSLTDTRNTLSAILRDMMAVKRIQPTDVCFMARRIDWVSGMVYARYDDDVVLDTLDFYVMTDDFNVYKCLNNNAGGQSTVKPTHTTLEPSEGADGYVWQYLYTVLESDQLKFLTEDYIPVRFYSTINRFNINGFIDSVDVDDVGTLYGEAPTVVITGDGTGATAVATVSFGAVVSVDVITQGSGYSFANIELVSNTGSGAVARAVLGRTDEADDNSLVAAYAESTDGAIQAIDIVNGGTNYVGANTSAAVVGDGTGATVTLTITDGVITAAELATAGTGYTYATVQITTSSGSGAELTAVVGPQGGHGSNLPEELLATTLGVVVEVTEDDNDFDAVAEFRQYGIVKNLKTTDGDLLQSDSAPVSEINTNSGIVLYAANTTVIERAPAQSETVRMLLNF